MILYYMLILMLPFYYLRWVNGTVGPFSIIKYVGFGVGFVALGAALKNGRMPSLLSTTSSRWFMMLLVWVGLSLGRLMLGYGVYMSLALQMYLSLFCLLFATLALVDSEKALRRAFYASIFSMVVATAYLIREYTQYSGMYDNFRPGSTSGDPNYYSSSVLIVLPLVFAAYRTEERKSWRIALLGIGGLLLIGIGLAGSRGGFLGLALAITFLAWRTRAFVKALVLGAIIIVPMLTMPHGPLYRFLHPVYADQLAVDTRIQTWNIGVEMIKEHPLVGVCIGRFRREVWLHYQRSGESGQIHVAHNTYLEYAAETGLPGAILFIGVLVGTFRELQRTRKLAQEVGNRFLAEYAQAIQAGIVGFAVTSFFLSAASQKVFWFVIFISTPMLRLAERQSPQPAEEAHAESCEIEYA